MNKTEIALISDIHGNAWALKAVLADIKNRGIDAMLNLGDSLFGPLDPQGTFDLLRNENMLSISGNQDRFIVENIGKRSDNHSLEFVKASLNDDAIAWLQKLPFDHSYGNIYCCHGTPTNDSEVLLEKIEVGHVSVQPNIVLDDVLASINESIVVCGHSHVPRMVQTSKKTILNPGSVGLPAYDADFPLPHKMESLSPLAKYAIIKQKEKGLDIDLIAVNYDYEKAALQAEKNNRADWASWIRSGRA